MNNKLELHQTVLLVLCVILAIITSFLAGMLLMQKRKDVVIAVNAQEIDNYSRTLAEYTQNVSVLEEEIAELELGLDFYDSQTQDYSLEKQDLLIEINKLKSQVVTLNAEIERRNNLFPFQVPTKGIVGSVNGFFGGQMYHLDHLGIDIWTSNLNGGKLPDHKGNPVFAACNGVVVSYQEGNGGMTINCDLIPKDKGYKLPAYDVFTYYGHMGHAETKELYFQVKIGDRVKAGQLVGYQGDLSSFFPNMRNVHLHFSVFTGLGETDPNGGALNPCLYIGGECETLGYQFDI